MASNLLEVYRGDSDFADIVLYDDDGLVPLDLTNKQVRLTVKRQLGDPDGEALFYLDETNGGVIVVDPLQGECRAVFEGAHTRNIEPGNYWYDIKVYWVDENQRERRKTVIYDTFAVLSVVWRGEAEQP